MEITIYTSEDAWRELLRRRHANLIQAGWEFVRDLYFGVRQFGATEDRRRELLEQAACHLGVGVKYLMSLLNMFTSPVASIAMELNVNQGANLSITHALAVYGIEPDAARDLLTTAAEENWSSELLRAKVWMMNNRPPQTGDRFGGTYQPQQNLLQPPPEQQHVSHQEAAELATQIREINRQRWATTTGANLPAKLSTNEHTAFALYGRTAVDAAHWWRADHCKQAQEEADHLRNINRWPLAKHDAYYYNLRDLLCELYEITVEQFEADAETARAYPPDARRQNNVVNYSYHVALRNNPERNYYLDLATKEKLSLFALGKYTERNNDHGTDQHTQPKPEG